MRLFGQSKIECLGENHRGAVFVLLAICVSVLIAMVALAVDIALFTSQKTKYERTAEQAALAALESYMNLLGHNNQGPSEALTGAITRASELSGLNLEEYFGSAFVANKNAELANLGTSEGTDVGKVTPGKWFFSESDGDWKNECDNPPATFRPCFKSLTSNERANAIKVQLKTSAGTMMRVLFPVLVPDYHPQLDVSAIASLVPRRGVFLIDLSPSIVADTHPTSDYAYMVDKFSHSDVICNAGSVDWWTKLDNWISPTQQSRFSSLQANAPDPRPADSTIHYKSDFQCHAVNLEDNIEEQYGIDTRSAEPLDSVLTAIHTALVRFRDRGVSADLVGVLGFDNALLKVRTMDMASPAQNLGGSSDDPTVYDKFLLATDTSKPISERAKQFLYPRLYGGEETASLFPPANRSPALTDINQALTKAKEMIGEQEGSEVADKFVVLISDGLGNCTTTPPAGGTGTCYYNMSTAQTRTLSEQYVQTALNEATEIADDYTREGIVLHTFLVGATIAPHTLVRKNGSACMTDRDARQHQPPLSFVDFSGGTISSTDNVPYYYPNKWYEEVSQTEGKWVPIVDCCRLTAGGPCADVTATLDAACGAALVPNGNIVPNINTVYPPVDANGRLICDREGRSKQQAVIDAIDTIMDRNPFILVR